MLTQRWRWLLAVVALGTIALTALAQGAATSDARAVHAPAALAPAQPNLWLSTPRAALPDALQPLDDIAQVAAGGNHTCAVTTAGGVKCWGANWQGQLGDGTTTDRSTPVAVSGLASGVSAISAGDSHTCALTTAGGILCWGANGSGQLGDGTTADRNTPVAVNGLASGADAVTAGSIHTCALTTTGSSFCWGHNQLGQLGDGTTTDRSTPVAVSGLASGVRELHAGGGHTCALTTAGGALCWGNNLYGQLGDGTTTSRNTPVAVNGLASSVGAVSAGGIHTCALTTMGISFCWGNNLSGQLGDGTTTDRSMPVAVSGLASSVSAVNARGDHTCALTTAGGVLCWGDNQYGQLGDGTQTYRSTPVVVSGLESAVSAGDNHTCVVTTAGGVKCWGNNLYGQLGDGTTMARSTPVAVSGLASGVDSFHADGSHTCALTTAGGVLCWGYNHFSQLGDGTTTNRNTPVVVSGLASGVSAVSAGAIHTCALTTSGGVLCWGGNQYGQLGDGTQTYRSPPVAVIGLEIAVSAVTAGGNHTCALTTAEGVTCWGWNYSGQLGDGTTTNRSTPVDVVGLGSGVRAVTAGDDHTCALTITGDVKCWGTNGFGELGDGTTADRSTPVDVVGLGSGGSAVTTGGRHTCAVTTTGGVQCWGGNYHGQLGDGTTVNRRTPVNVVGLGGGVSAITAGDSHTCAVTTVGGIKCWGSNGSGQLGDGTTANRGTPVDVVGLGSGVSAITAGDSHTCAVTTAGGVQCWGGNYHGQLGDGNAWRTTPVDVMQEVTPTPTPTPTFTNTPLVPPTLTIRDRASCETIGGAWTEAEQRCDMFSWTIEADQSLEVAENATLHSTLGTNSGELTVHGIYLGFFLYNDGVITNYGRMTVGSDPLANNTIIHNYGEIIDTRFSNGGTVDNHCIGVIVNPTNDGQQIINSPGDLTCVPAPTPTPTLSSTPPPTPTFTNTPPPLTPTNTPTATQTSTPTFTPILTPTTAPTATPTNTPRPLTSTPTNTPTATPTNTPTATPTTVPTATPTNTPTATPTNTPTPTPTLVSSGDAYESDDDCLNARTINMDGASQQHTFHRVADVDWVQFDAVADQTYRIDVQMPLTSLADVNLELYDNCDDLPVDDWHESFTPGVRMDFTPSASGPVYLRLTNHDATVFGAEANYTILVRAMEAAPTNRALVIVAGRLRGADHLQANIHQVATAVYTLFARNGYTDEKIYLLATNSNLPGYDAAATRQHLRGTITTWAREQLGPDGVFTLYMVDHGRPGIFYLDELNGQRVMPAELDGWLDELEAAVPGLKVNVVIEACQSGSFIGVGDRLSKQGRVVITSSDAQHDAMASISGAYFSDHLLTWLHQGYNLAASFAEARAVAQGAYALQNSWLDADGDGVPNEFEDATLAARRSFAYAGTLAGEAWSPHIFSAQPPAAITNYSGTVRADVRDDVRVSQVWGVVYPPGYTPPETTQELQSEVLVNFLLTPAGEENIYAGRYDGFTQNGVYRIVIHAVDNEGLVAPPRTVEVRVGENRNFLPIIERQQ